MTSALLVLSFQHDLWNAIDQPSEVLGKLKLLVSASRRANQSLFWIYSAFGGLGEDTPPKPLVRPNLEAKNIPLNDSILAGTHSNKNLCVPGSKGARWIPAVAKLQQKKQDIAIAKQYFSAFTDTSLEQKLKEQNIQTLYICGVNTSTCVQATAVDAFALGFRVCVVRNASCLKESSSFQPFTVMSFSIGTRLLCCSFK